VIIEPGSTEAALHSFAARVVECIILTINNMVLSVLLPFRVQRDPNVSREYVASIFRVPCLTFLKWGQYVTAKHRAVSELHSDRTQKNVLGTYLEYILLVILS
jgi:hypothetical protein